MRRIFAAFFAGMHLLALTQLAQRREGGRFFLSFLSPGVDAIICARSLPFSCRFSCSPGIFRVSERSSSGQMVVAGVGIGCGGRDL